MSLDGLVAEIESRTRQALAQERAAFDAERTKIVAERDRRIAELRAESERQAELAAARERTRRLAAARLAAKKLEYEFRERRTRELLAAVRAELGDYTRTAQYPRLLKRMYAAAVGQLGKDARVRGRAEDARTLKGIAGSGFDPAALPVLGGLVAETPDGSRRLDLTFDELLRLREDRLRTVLPD